MDVSEQLYLGITIAQVNRSLEVETAVSAVPFATSSSISLSEMDLKGRSEITASRASHIGETDPKLPKQLLNKTDSEKTCCGTQVNDSQRGLTCWSILLHEREDAYGRKPG